MLASPHGSRLRGESGATLLTTALDDQTTAAGGHAGHDSRFSLKALAERKEVMRMANQVSVNKDRILEEFFRLTSFDAPSYQEAKIAKYLKEKLESLGLRVEEDDAREKLLKEDASRKEAASNLYAYLKGTGDPILFSSHMDTVNPGIGKKAVLHDDGRITSAGNTVLGADDVSGPRGGACCARTPSF